MMGTLVQVQLHMFSYKKILFSAEKLAKLQNKKRGYLVRIGHKGL